jgi:KaiC/GvpD/RAD55 family RecA-like ATPase
MPTVLQPLASQGQHIRRGEVTMIAGQPGAGKSLFALWHGTHWALGELKGIYFSADSAELGQAARALAMVMMGVTYREAESLLEREDPYALEGLGRINNLFWSFEDDLSYENIDHEILAFIELWGTAPDFIIVDNLTDVEGQNEDEGATQR